MPRDPKLEVSLLLMRLTLAAFMLVWAVDKVIAPDHAQAVFARYYFTDLSHQPLVIIGIVQIAVIAAFAAGFARFWTYGAVLLLHTVDGIDLCSAGKSLGGGARGLLFWAAVPVLAAALALFLLRDRDRLLSVDAAGWARGLRQ